MLGLLWTAFFIDNMHTCFQTFQMTLVELIFDTFFTQKINFFIRVIFINFEILVFIHISLAFVDIKLFSDESIQFYLQKLNCSFSLNSIGKMSFLFG